MRRIDALNFWSREVVRLSTRSVGSSYLVGQAARLIPFNRDLTCSKLIFVQEVLDSPTLSGGSCCTRPKASWLASLPDSQPCFSNSLWGDWLRDTRSRLLNFYFIDVLIELWHDLLIFELRQVWNRFAILLVWKLIAKHIGIFLEKLRAGQENLVPFEMLLNFLIHVLHVEWLVTFHMFFKFKF